MNGRRLALSLLSPAALVALGCTPIGLPEAPPQEPRAVSPASASTAPERAATATPATPDDDVEPRTRSGEDSDTPPAAPDAEVVDAEVPPADVGSRDPFNSDVVDQNREGTYILERALAPVERKTSP
jgi:hypothetical protein